MLGLITGAVRCMDTLVGATYKGRGKNQTWNEVCCCCMHVRTSNSWFACMKMCQPVRCAGDRKQIDTKRPNPSALRPLPPRAAFWLVVVGVNLFAGSSSGSVAMSEGQLGLIAHCAWHMQLLLVEVHVEVSGAASTCGAAHQLQMLAVLLLLQLLSMTGVCATPTAASMPRQQKVVPAVLCTPKGPAQQQSQPNPNP